MIPTRHLPILIVTLLSTTAGAQVSERDRLSGFAEHQKNQKQFEDARARGEREFLEDEELWENQKTRSLQAYKSEKKNEAMTEDSPQAQADAADKQEYEQMREKILKSYSEERAKAKALSRRAENLPSEEEELGLLDQRPRYEFRKRAFFGGKPGAGRSSSAPSAGSSSPSFPPPPTFDDFGDGGYVPAPNMSDDFGDVPPPPPPPPPSSFDDFGSDFAPPPPPPPPPFGDDGDF